ncbi:2312_t:CDS:2 [Funneliformis caledonium]|uniref:2312_t:CDS:1 n=1 Tax=Funneliformis caledonium TaxID=1117310 RepID=A0A9N9B5M4_9GLOM|nr:2312_t:CDS:2 [Funneliformis caledonium]
MSSRGLGSYNGKSKSYGSYGGGLEGHGSHGSNELKGHSSYSSSEPKGYGSRSSGEPRDHGNYSESKALQRKSRNNLSGELEECENTDEHSEYATSHPLVHGKERPVTLKNKNEKENLALVGPQDFSSFTDVINLFQQELKEYKKKRNEIFNLLRQELKDSKEKIETVSYSSVTTAKYSKFLMHSGFKIDSLTYQKNLQKKEIPAFEWSNHTENFVE